MAQVIKQFIEENISTIWPLALILVWFVITAINDHFHKKFLFALEIVVLLTNMVGNIYVAYSYVNDIETYETSLILFVWAVTNLGLLILVVQKFLYSLYCNKHPKI